MFRRIVIVLSVLGAALAVYVAATAQRPTPAPPPAQPPSSNPFDTGIVAIGVVEPASRVVDVAAPEPARVVEVFAEVGDTVEAGAPLFRLDTVPLDAELVRALSAVDQARAEVERLDHWPRPEDVIPVRAEVEEWRQRLNDADDRMASMDAARRGGAASDDEYRRQRFLVSVIRAQLAGAEARLARLDAGSWEQDLAVARAALRAREADVRAAEMRRERLTVRAPIGGTVLKRNIEPGEYASGASPSPAAMPGSSGAPFVLGDLSTMRIRAQVDEEDTPLLRPGARAIARVRGPVSTPIPLEMLRVEPLARPKTQISGASTELVDTRVIEAVFIARPGPDAPALYPGQIVDVFIDAGEDQGEGETAL